MRPARLRNIPFWYVGKFQKIRSSAIVTYMTSTVKKDHHSRRSRMSRAKWHHVALCASSHSWVVQWFKVPKGLRGSSCTTYTTQDFTHVVMVLFKLNICSKCEMLGPSIRSFFVTSGDHDFVVKQIRHLQKRCIHIIHACHIQLFYKFNQGKDFQFHWAISTAAIQLLIGVGHRGQPDGPPRKHRDVRHRAEKLAHGG